MCSFVAQHACVGLRSVASEQASPTTNFPSAKRPVKSREDITSYDTVQRHLAASGDLLQLCQRRPIKLTVRTIFTALPPGSSLAKTDVDGLEAYRSVLDSSTFWQQQQYLVQYQSL